VTNRPLKCIVKCPKCTFRPARGGRLTISRTARIQLVLAISFSVSTRLSRHFSWNMPQSFSLSGPGLC